MRPFDVDIKKISTRHNFNPASQQDNIETLHPIWEDGLI